MTDKPSSHGTVRHERWDVIEGEDGALTIIVPTTPGEPVEPRLVFDGKAMLVLFRGPGDLVQLPKVADSLAPSLREATSALVAEVGEDTIAFAYEAPVALLRPDDPATLREAFA